MHKQTIKQLKPNCWPLLLGLFLVMQLLTGCVTYQRCAQKYAYKGDSLKVIAKLEVPRDSAAALIRLDSMQKLRPKDTLRVQSGRARLTIVKEQAPQKQDTLVILDTFGRRQSAHPVPPDDWFYISAECDSVVVYKAVECPPSTVFACPDPQAHEKDNKAKAAGFFARLWQGWQRFAGFAVLVQLAVFILMRLRFRILLGVRSP